MAAKPKQPKAEEAKTVQQLADAMQVMLQRMQSVAIRQSDFDLLDALAQEKRATKKPVDAFLASRIENLIGRLQGR